MGRKQNEKGFTLVELLITIAIVVIIGAIGFINFANYRQRNNVKLTAQEIIALLRDAQNRAIAQDSGTSWGVQFNNPSSTYAEFSGGSFSPGSILSQSSLPTNLIFLVPGPGTSSSVVFATLTGAPTSTSGMVSTTVPFATIVDPGNPNSVSSSIYINPNGETYYQ